MLSHSTLSVAIKMINTVSGDLSKLIFEISFYNIRIIYRVVERLYRYKLTAEILEEEWKDILRGK